MKSGQVTKDDDSNKFGHWPGILSLSGHLKHSITERLKIAIFRAIAFTTIVKYYKRLPPVCALILLLIVPKVAVLAEARLKWVALSK